MRLRFWGCWMLCFCFWLPCAGAAPISLHVIDGDVRTILSSTAGMGGVNLILDDSVCGKLTLQLDDVEPEAALRLIAQTKGLSFIRTGNTIIISTPKIVGRSFYKMHVFSVHYADLEILRDAVNLSAREEGFVPQMQNIEEGTKSREPRPKAIESADGLRRSGRLLIDKIANTLIFYGTDDEADEIRKLIAGLDIPSRQVSLEAKVVAIQKDAARKLGIEWEWSKLPQYPSTTTTYESVHRAVQNADGSYAKVSEDVPKTSVERIWKNGESVPGIMRFGRGPEGYPFEFYYAAQLQALITNGKANILARPNITTLQGREAVINIGGEVPVPTVAVTDRTTTTSIVYRPAGIILRYTPRVNEDGYITAAVHTEVSSPLYVEELKAYRFQKRAADTVVRLKDGETMVIGGLIGSEESRSLSKVPFLGDIPVLGAFFRSVRNTKTDSEIMIFLTAHVLKDS
jgi:type IV pilus assembly protein PilQ